jgi:hypothetical protein
MLLGYDQCVTRIAVYRDGKLFPHEGQRTPLSKFKLEVRELYDGITFGTPFQQRGKQIRQEMNELQQTAMGYITGRHDNDEEPHDDGDDADSSQSAAANENMEK